MCRKRCRSELIDSAWVFIVPGQKCIKNYIKTLFKNISTLKDFVVGIQGVKINCDLVKYIVLMCMETTVGLQMQCGRDYGFPSIENENQGATDLATLSQNQLDWLLTNNLSVERNLQYLTDELTKLLELETKNLQQNVSNTI